MDLISEKDEEIGFDLTRNTADGVSGETRLSNVPGLSNKVRISFGERCIWLSATILLGFLCVGLGVQLGKAMERSPAYKETDLGKSSPLSKRLDEEEQKANNVQYR